MRTLGLFSRMLLAALKDFMKREVRPCNNYEQLPPIRCGCDPTEIYLA